jgi:hypothetical protein
MKTFVLLALGSLILMGCSDPYRSERDRTFEHCVRYHSPKECTDAAYKLHPIQQ